MERDQALWLRAGGHCECCGKVAGWDGWSRHHRQPRGMGGTKRDVHGLDNLLLLCGSGTTGCHGYVESHRAWARDCGLLVPRPLDPAATPVLLRARTLFPRWVTLTPEGDAEPLIDSPPLVLPPR
jgi:hypothetical protein